MTIIANELRTTEEHLAEFPGMKAQSEVVLRRLERVRPLPAGSRVLDVGAAAGNFVLACRQLGYVCEGVEPGANARAAAAALGEHLRSPLELAEGSAESIPFPDASFDLVHAASVIEHVIDLDKAISEVYRVLKPGGVFWFNSASSMSPWQGEIRGFPLFGWYPNSVKLKIMNWVKDAKPELVGYSRTPAIHWFTPKKARRMLHRHGFERVFDRWDLRREEEGSAKYRLVLRLIRSSPPARFLADVAVGGCSYAAVK